MPREVPLTSSMTPLRASACRCSSAALADLKPSSFGDFGARGRRTGACDGALDQIQDLLLAGGKLDGELHVGFLAALAAYPVPVFLTSFWKVDKTWSNNMHSACAPSWWSWAPAAPLLARAASSGDNIGYTAGAGGRGRSAGAASRRPPGVAAARPSRWRRSTARTWAFDDLAAAGAALCALAGAARRGGRGDHARHRHAGGDGVLPARPCCAPVKPVVLTCAMRPATALAPDGPQNVRDAISVAATAGARGVTVVCAGAIHSGIDIQKVHTYRRDAFAFGRCGAGRLCRGRRGARVRGGLRDRRRRRRSSSRRPACSGPRRDRHEPCRRRAAR